MQWKLKVLKFVCWVLKVPYDDFVQQHLPLEQLVVVTRHQLDVHELSVKTMLSADIIRQSYAYKNTGFNDFIEACRKAIESDSFLPNGRPIKLTTELPEVVKKEIIHRFLAMFDKDFYNMFTLTVIDDYMESQRFIIEAKLLVAINPNKST